jgi:hypothetical protein
VQDALKVLFPPRPSLQNDFRLATQVQSPVNDMMKIDGIVRKEFAKDEPFIGPVGEQPRPSFKVVQDVYKGYMLLVRPGDEEIKSKLYG